MWQDLWSALALVLVIEGIMPFIAPDRFKEVLRTMLDMNVRQLRMLGSASMAAGLIFLTFIRNS